MRRGISGEQILSKDYERAQKLLVGEYIAEGETLLLYAPTGQGKTVNACMLAVSLTCQVPFYDWKIHKPVNVLFVEGGELTAYGIGERFKAIYKRNGIIKGDPGLERLHLKSPTEAQPFVFNITEPVQQKVLKEYIIEHDIGCVIFDNYNSLRREEDNEFQSWQRLENFLNELKTMKVASVVIHHTNKEGKQQSGAQRKADFVDCVIRIQKSRLSTKHNQYIEVEMQKFRWGAEAPIKLTELSFDDGEISLSPADYDSVLKDSIMQDLLEYGAQYVKQKYRFLDYKLFHYIDAETPSQDSSIS